MKKYIFCLMLFDLNTLYVDIKRSRITLCIASVLNLNTLYVDIKRVPIKSPVRKYKFKYIIC